MRQIKRQEIHPIKMATNCPEEIINCGMKCISNGQIYEHVGIGWVKIGKANIADYKEIPELID